MTPRARQILDFVTGYIRGTGSSPSLVEIADALGYSLKSKAAVKAIIDRLVLDGDLCRRPGRYKSLYLPPRLSRFTNDELIAELKTRGVAIGLNLPAPDREQKA